MPLSLLSCVEKIMKNVLASSVIHHHTNSKLVRLEQFGFPEGRFVSDLRMGLTTEWQDAVKQGLDKSGISNKIRQSRLLVKLGSNGVSFSFFSCVQEIAK